MSVQPMKLGTLIEIESEITAFRQLLAEPTGSLAVMTITSEGLILTRNLDHRLQHPFALTKMLKIEEEDAKMISGRMRDLDVEKQVAVFVRWLEDETTEFAVVTIAVDQSAVA